MMMQDTQKTENATPFRASEYERNIRKTLPFYEAFHTESIDLIKTLRPDVKVWLDSGCGAGSFVRKAIAHFPDTLFVLSDISEAMLDKAKQELADLTQSQLRFLKATGTEDLVLQDSEQPQVLTAILVHHYLSREARKRATQRCFELLPSQGIYLYFENIYPSSAEGTEFALQRWKRYQSSQGKDERTVEEHAKRFNKAYFPISINEHRQLLSQSGFRTVEMFWLSHIQAGFYAIK